LTFGASKTTALILLKFIVVTYWTLDYKQYKFILGAPLGLGEIGKEQDVQHFSSKHVFVYHNVKKLPLKDNSQKRNYN